MHTSTLWQDLIDAYCENKMYAELKELLIENKNVLQVLSIMNSISSEARKIAEDNSDLEFAKYLVDYSVDISK